MPEYWTTYQRLKPISDGLWNIKFAKAKEKLTGEHKVELEQQDDVFYEGRYLYIGLI